MVEFLIAVIALQFLVGIIIYFDARRRAKRAVLEFLDRAKQVDARLGQLGTAVGNLHNEHRARLDVLGTAIGHLRNRVEVMFDGLKILLYANERKLNYLQQQTTGLQFSLEKEGIPDAVSVSVLDEIPSDGWADVSCRRQVTTSAPGGHSRTSVIITLGQSNAANCGDAAYSPCERIDNFNLYDGLCYQAVDPLLGAFGSGGNFATRLGDILVKRGLFDRVIIAPIARGGSTVEQWADEGPFNRVIHALVRRLHEADLSPDFILWQQGLGNRGAGDPDGRIYRKNILEVVRTFRSLGVRAPFFIALESGKSVGDPAAANIRTGQRSAVNPAIGIFPGPDIDLIGQEHRRDGGCHFRDTGLWMAATMWADTLSEFKVRFDWAAAISSAMANSRNTVTADKLLRIRQTGQHPVDLRCDDGNVYVVKGLRTDDPKAGRLLFNEHVVARLGTLLGAPIPPVKLVSITNNLISRYPDEVEGLGQIQPGLAHGSRFREGLGERIDAIKHIEINRSRFASLAILYSWTKANDRHFLFDGQYHVYSVDHGLFFPGGPHWNIRDLEEIESPMNVDDLIQTCELTSENLAAASAPLQTISQRQIAEIVGVVPYEWGVTFPERLAVARFLRVRQLQLLAIFGVPLHCAREMPVHGTANLSATRKTVAM